MVSTEDGIWITVTIVLAALLAGIFVPIGLDAVTGVTHDNQANFTQEENVRIVIEEPLHSNATDIEDPLLLGDPEVTIELINNETGESTKRSFLEGEEADMRISEKTVHVHVTDIVNDSAADVSYEYPERFRWTNEATSLWDFLDFVMNLVLLVGALAFLWIGLRY